MYSPRTRPLQFWIFYLFKFFLPITYFLLIQKKIIPRRKHQLPVHQWVSRISESSSFRSLLAQAGVEVRSSSYPREWGGIESNVPAGFSGEPGWQHCIQQQKCDRQARGSGLSSRPRSTRWKKHSIHDPWCRRGSHVTYLST